MFKKLREFIFGKSESYLVLCLNDNQAADLYTRVKRYVRRNYSPMCLTGHLCSPREYYIHVWERKGDTRLKFVSIRSNAYIATQVEHKGKTIAWTIVDEFLDEHEEKKDANT